MLQLIRERLGGWFFIVMLAFIALAFTFWGVDFGIANKRSIAKVNGEEVPVQMIQRNYQNNLSNMRRFTNGAEVSEAMQNQMKSAVVEQAVTETLLQQQTRKPTLMQRVFGGQWNKPLYQVSDATLSEQIRDNAAFKADGTFSPTQYQAVLANNNLSSTHYEFLERQRLQRNQLIDGIERTAFVTASEATQFAELENERRQVITVTLDPETRLADIDVTADAIETHFQDNASDYMTEEMVDVDYLQLSTADLTAKINIDEAELQAYYDEEADKGRFEEEEETRRARHILLSIDATADQAARDEVETKAEGIMAELQAGADFAELAKTHSDDPGSKNAGGDLGDANRTQFVGPFADAVFSMKQGELRGPIKTRFGYHLIELLDINAGKQTTFADARDDLLNELKLQSVADQFGALSDEMDELAFEYVGELTPIADALALPVLSASNITRATSSGLFSETELNQAIFSERILDKQENSRLLEAEDGSVLVLRVAKRTLPQQKPLADVRDDIVSTLKLKQAKADILAEANALLDAAGEQSLLGQLAGDANLTVDEPVWIDRRNTDVPVSVREQAFLLPVMAAGHSDIELAEADGKSILLQVLAREAGAGSNPAQVIQLAQQKGTEELRTYAGALRERAKVTIQLDQLQ